MLVVDYVVTDKTKAKLRKVQVNVGGEGVDSEELVKKILKKAYGGKPSNCDHS